MVPVGWCADNLPPCVNMDKLNTYLCAVSGKTIVPKDASTSPFHGWATWSKYERKYIKPTYIQILGKISKFVTLKNRKKLDVNYNDFELTENSLNDGSWGLTEPNLEAYYKNLGKLNKAEHLTFDDDAAEFATHCMEQHFYSHLKNSVIETQEESLLRHDLSKSPGPPWNFVHKTKKTLIDDAQFLEFCRKGWDWLLDDEFWFLGGTALKEEIRSAEKLAENKQRIFIPNSADFVTLTNRLCGDFNDKFTECHLKTASAVGINPFSGGWQRVRNRLTKFKKMAEYDFSDYDSSLGVHKLLIVCKFRFKCLRAEDQTFDNWHRMLNCYKNIIWTVVVLVDGTLAIKPGGNPSGGANTVVDNTLVNYWSQAYAYYRCVTEEFRTYSQFNNYVSASMYGDDNTNSISDVIADQFTPARYCAAVAELGMTCNSVSQDWLTINDVTFLQADFNTFLYDTCVYHVQPSKSYESMRWSEDPKNAIMSLQRAVGMHRVTWTDPIARNHYTKYISYLLKKHDTLLSGVKEWEDVKAGIKPDCTMASFFTGLESKDQKDFQTSGGCDTVFFQAEARGKRGKKNRGGKAPPVPSRKSAAYKQGRRSVMQHRSRVNKNKGRNGGRRKGGGTGSARANVRITQAPVSTANVMSFPREKKPFVGTHFEKLADINGTSAFTTTSYSLNPGLAATFPWMAAIAENFEFYKFLNLEFWYIQATATSTTGTVYMAFDPDAVDDPPPSSTALIDLNVKTVGSPYVNLKLRIPPKSKFVKDLYVRTGAVSGTDLKTYDLGNFYIATDGCNVTTKIGALFVSYRVALISPELPISSQFVAGLNVFSTVPVTANLFASPSIFGDTNIGSFTGNIFTFAQAFSSMLIAWTVAATSSNFSGSSMVTSNSFTTDHAVGSASGSLGAFQAVIRNVAVGDTVTFSCTLVSGTESDVYFSALPASVSLIENKEEEILFEKFQKMMRREANLRALEDRKIEQRLLKIEQNEEEELDLSDDSEITTEILLNEKGQKIVRLKNEPCVNQTIEAFHEGSMGYGSAMHVEAKKQARLDAIRAVFPTPTETKSISVKGKEKQ